MSTTSVYYCPGCDLNFATPGALSNCPECGAWVELKGHTPRKRPKKTGPPNTPAQRKILIVLFEGGAVQKNGPRQYKLLTRDGHLARRFSALTFGAIEGYLTATDRGLVVSHDKILQERRPAWIRREYVRRLG